MSKRSKRNFSLDVKKQAVDDFVTGRKPAQEIANKLDITTAMLYKWRTWLDERDKGARLSELELQGHDPGQAKRIIELEDEVATYQKKVAELTVINDLLKKLQTPKSLAPESELTGLIATTKKLDRKRRLVK